MAGKGEISRRAGPLQGQGLSTRSRILKHQSDIILLRILMWLFKNLRVRRDTSVR